MKELSIEEKAIRYDEAIEKLRNAFYDNNSRMCEEYRNAVIRIIEPIFPELKENEDERIRKTLIKYFRNCVSLEGINGEDISNWLEKQGEQKSIESTKTKLNESMIKPDPNPYWTLAPEYKLMNEQRSAWSEEDERIHHSLIIDLSNAQTDDEKVQNEINEEINWLKSLKDRVQPQPKQEWSEDEKAMIDEMHEFFDKHKFPSLKHGLDKYAKFLESLRLQSQWKPSEEQMEALRIAAYEPTKNWKEELQTLYMELKKLIE